MWTIIHDIHICTRVCSYIHTYIHTHIHTYIHIYIHIKAGTNSQYQIRSFVKKSFEGFEGSHVFLILFINVALTWIGYRKPPKLDYCFIMSTNLVPVAVSTQI